MKFYVLASSSSGNASYLQTKTRKILIDAGLSYTTIKERLNNIGIDLKELTDIFITHEHTDHIKGLEILLKHTKANLYMSEGTNKGLKIKPAYTRIVAFADIVLDEVVIKPLPLSHDANEPLGFLFTNGRKSLAYITDTGYLYQEVLALIENCDVYFFESNHDPHLLTNSSRPYYLIYRILNEKGHLSNYDSAYYLTKLIGDNTKYIIYAHISQECNNLNLIENTFEDVFKANELNIERIKFIEAKSNEALKVIEI